MFKKEDLSNFYGSDQFTLVRFFGREFLITSGVDFVLANGGDGENGTAHWLLDAILSHQGNRKLKTERMREFQVWKLKKMKGTKARLSCEDGDGLEVVRQIIPYTDFCIDEISIWGEMNSMGGMTFLLPSEH